MEYKVPLIYLPVFMIWVSATKQASHTLKLSTLWWKKGTEKLAPVTCAHAVAEEGYREACSCHLCPRCGRRRVQMSLLLSPVPTLRRKKGTDELALVTCAHAVAEGGYRLASSYHLYPRCGGGFQQKRTAPPDVDAAETVRFSWKVVGLTGATRTRCSR